MSGTLTAIARLVASGRYRVSDHAYEELAKDGILPSVVVNDVETVQVVEDYPDANRGPSVLVLGKDWESRPLHAVWGIPRQRPDIAVLITVYRPDPKAWSNDFLTRTKR